MIGNGGHLRIIAFTAYCLDMRRFLRLTNRFTLCGASLRCDVVSPAGAAPAAPRPAGPTPAAPIPVKVVVVTMFEIGKMTGDKPGEAQFWVERDKLDRVLPFPLGEYELRMNDAGLLLICTGGGVTNSSSSIMALGLDPRFDLSKALAGRRHRGRRSARCVAGHGGMGEVRGRWRSALRDRCARIPADWPYGLLPLGAKKPKTSPAVGRWIRFTTRSTRVWWTGLFAHQGSSRRDSPGIAIPPAIRGLSRRAASAVRDHRRFPSSSGTGMASA